MISIIHAVPMLAQWTTDQDILDILAYIQDSAQLTRRSLITRMNNLKLAAQAQKKARRGTPPQQA